MSQRQLPPALQRKLSNLQDQGASEIWSKDLLTSLSTSNTPHTRRNLRTLIERQIVASHARYLAETETLLSSVGQVEGTLNSLQGLCERMRSVLETREGEVSGVLNEIGGIERAIEVTEARKGWLEEYQSKYQLPPETAQILERGKIDDEFFDALKRVQAVYANCKSLGLSSGASTSLKGLQLVEELSTRQDEAFRHVCAWIQTECQHIESPEDVQSVEIMELMPKAMRCLRARPPLYSYCAEEIAIARKTAIFQKFIHALSQGARPIEAHAGDPWRYANDMLAWIHASIAGEMELVGVLFEGCYSSESGLVKRTASLEMVKEGDGDGSSENSEHISLQEIMDTIFESVCRPLKLRLEQMLVAAPSPVLNFQLITLFSFYLKTIAPVMGDGSNLSRTLRGCCGVAKKTLKDQMKQRGERLVRQPPRPPNDLSFPDAYADRLGVAVDIIKFYESSFLVGNGSASSHAAAEDGDDKTDGGGKPATDILDVDELISIIVNPLVDSILASSDALNPTSSVRLDDSGITMNPSLEHIYVLNCMSHIRSRIGVYESAAELCVRLTEQIHGVAQKLVDLQTEAVLHGTGMNGADMNDEDMSIQSASNAASALWTKLQDMPVVPPEYAQILDSTERNSIEQDIVTNILDAYLRAYHRCALDDDLRGSLHTPEEMKSSLSLCN